MSGTANSKPTGTSSCKADTVTAHSKCFGPSSSHSWLHCPYSAIARNNIPDKSSVYAETGTLAHELCEIKLKLYFDQITPEEYSDRLAKIQANPLYTADMLSNSETYLQTIRELSISHYSFAPIVYIEQQVKYDDICGDDGFGTSDCILLGGDTLTVVDYKNGQGVAVSARNNPQMRLYAYGALHSVVIPYLYDIKKIVMCIVQPNISDTASVEIITKDELLEWVETVVKPAAAKIQSGSKDRVPGKWCSDGFCPNFTQCRAWCEKFAAVYADYQTDYSEADIDSMSNDELGDLYTKVKEISAWIKKLDKKVESLLTAGKPVKGWKLVAGRSTRAFTDVDKAYEALSEAANIDKEMFYSRVPLGITEASKLVGKKLFDTTCEPYMTKSPGKPAVTPESDPREPINASASSDFEDLTPAPEAPEKSTKKKKSDKSKEVS